MQSFVSVVTGTITSNKFKHTIAVTGSNLAAGIYRDYIPGAQD